MPRTKRNSTHPPVVPKAKAKVRPTEEGGLLTLEELVEKTGFMVLLRLPEGGWACSLQNGQAPVAGADRETAIRHATILLHRRTS